MPIFRLSKELIFPSPELAYPDGLLCFGGDLSPERLLLAYSSSIFPWYSDDSPEILWWSPDPRFVLFPEELKVSKSMKKILRKNLFRITIDTNFTEVMRECAKSRKDGMGTWITEKMIEAYTRLHNLGFAHSVEAWIDNNLVGGLYGVSLGKIFFGESMFTRVSNASKSCFITLVNILIKKGFKLIDSQVHTNHLESLGAKSISRKDYLNLLDNYLNYETHNYKWTDWIEVPENDKIEETYNE